MQISIHSTVYNNHYGSGEVTKVTGDNVYVAFGAKQRIFPHTKAIEWGWLSTDVREIVLDAANNIRYTTIFEAINYTVGTSYAGWQRATWPKPSPDLPFRLWFPKLAETRNDQLVSAAFDCVNTISEDWNEVVFDDLKDITDESDDPQYQGVTLIFAKEPKGGPYIFRGAFVSNTEKSTPKHYVSTRIGTKVKLIGNPSNRIEILDDFRSRAKIND